jgi:hypothetical protein
LFVNFSFCIFIGLRFRADDFQIPPHRQAVTLSEILNSMKHLFSILIFIIGLFLNSQAQSDSIAILLAKLNSKTITDSERKFLKVKAFDVQNRGQLLDEASHDYKGALLLTDSAINIFKALKDTLNEANNRKFKGYLLGRFGKFQEGKSEIQQAINLFQLKNTLWGVAVSQFDLARLFEFENKLDSAQHYCNIAISYWKENANTARVFLNQNMLINLLTKTNDLTKAKTVQNESNKIIEAKKPHWQGLLDFYIVSENLYKAAKEFETANNYRNLYSKLITELSSTGIAARSYFTQK